MFYHFKSVLALDGVLPKDCRKKDFLQQAIWIAADGAANTLIAQNIFPDWVVGDLDAISSENLNKIQTVLPRLDQNYTDFEKTLFEIEKAELFPVLILGLTGKELDHSLYNLQIFVQKSKYFRMVFYDCVEPTTPKWGVAVHGAFQVTLAQNTMLSILPYPEAVVSTAGLQWELERQVLSCSKGASVRNRARSQSIEITVHSGQVLALI